MIASLQLETPAVATKSTSVRVLFAQRDVIGKIGGGEAASARMFERTPHASVTWPVSQTPGTPLPVNFECTPLDVTFRSAMQARVRLIREEFPAADRADFYEALTIAHAVKGQTFDVVECPDYLTYGRFLPFAFAEYRVKYARLVASLHGRSSRTFEIENQFGEVVPPAQLEHLRSAERQFIFGAADVRYGFSERYVAQTKQLQPLPIALVDPLCAVPSMQRSAFDVRDRGRVWFVARQDRVKGADLFLAAIFRAGEDLWNRYSMCGPSVRFKDRVSIFETMAYCRKRGMPFHYRGPLRYDEISREAYDGGALVVVPSREETFSLVALEALMNGVPLLLSKHTGAAEFVRRRFGSNFAGAVIFDPLDEFAAARALRSMWEDWHEHRSALLRALRVTDLTPRPELLMDAYTLPPAYDDKLRDAACDAWNRMMKSYTNLKWTSPLRDDQEKQKARTPIVGKALFKLADETLTVQPDKNPFLCLDEARRLAGLSPHINRARIYRYLAECEETSRPTVAAAYRLRAFRMNALSTGEVASLAEQLQRHGFSEEETCLRLWSSGERNEPIDSIANYLEERHSRFLEISLPPCEYTIDRRDANAAKVSIVVSMYNAARPMLEHFLKHLAASAMVQRRCAEVIFVDSGSPQHQIELLRAIPSLQGISYVLVRSANRETIQTAWNRGIQTARGDYVTCLGVDEGVTEFAFDELARYLDQHPQIDWVTGNTVITQVDEHGQWKRDVMSYERSPYARFSYLNDCTYINYVGGLYRRSIHNRFGWYDGSFKGAGDTEFKCRIFRDVQTAVLPKTLGFYFDFPAERVTNSANIEIEDLRAWYVFRTPGGLDYLMRGRDIAGCEELFWTALAGRRCWSNTVDCDLSFAANVLVELLRREPAHSARVLGRALRALIREMHLLQTWPHQPWLGAIAESDLLERSRRFFRRCGKMRPDLSFPIDFRSDALFFAHSWTWR